MTFNKIISHWYRKNKRDLPWRKTRDPYRIWLSEIMLQQTRVEQGLPYYLKFVDHYPTIKHLADAPEDEVLKLWQGLGYYSRARNLHATARHVTYELNENFPSTYSEIIKLKGVGDYTASAIASICFDEATPVVDGNVYRVLARYFNVDIPINSTEGIKYFKQLATELIDREQPAEYNQAIMEFGARQCKPQSPDCGICPLNNSCGALAEKRIKELPVKIRKGKIRNRYFNYLVMTDKDSTLLEQRKQKDIWQSLYQFPLIEDARELEEKDIVSHNRFLELMGNREYDISLYNKEAIVHKLSHQHIHTRFWIVHLQGTLDNGIKSSRIKEYAVPVLIANFVEEYSF
ncbi:A/G-specific adenine glycosylase [Leptobacterium flavescens]|uniref:Adenine DNA glycosylase n=1 Tax=Leptobacterium flavescens TaxID=472055 RepID=A0A6P0UNI3_9FLAO|nr:A/G-specific adenine glycosylase [Leptobacterium flavescens]NER14527.1 A/G-specific adenine glycosylase [Leptobacterium flavescens]